MANAKRNLRQAQKRVGKEAAKYIYTNSAILCKFSNPTKSENVSHWTRHVEISAIADG